SVGVALWPKGTVAYGLEAREQDPRGREIYRAGGVGKFQARISGGNARAAAIRGAQHHAGARPGAGFEVFGNLRLPARQRHARSADSRLGAAALVDAP